jgi:hypothetical protein
MFKYTKRLISDIQFWSRELKIRAKENAEFERIEDETYTEMRHPMAGFAYYQTMKHNRKERLQQHKEKRALIK